MVLGSRTFIEYSSSVSEWASKQRAVFLVSSSEYTGSS